MKFLEVLNKADYWVNNEEYKQYLIFDLFVDGYRVSLEYCWDYWRKAYSYTLYICDDASQGESKYDYSYLYDHYKYTEDIMRYDFGYYDYEKIERIVKICQGFDINPNSEVKILGGVVEE